jgi:hypothetical protein
MAGLVPAIHVLQGCVRVDARDNPRIKSGGYRPTGHDVASGAHCSVSLLSGFRLSAIALARTTRTTVIVGLNPTIHAMTVQKRCPRNRPFAGIARARKAVGEVAGQFSGIVMAWMAGSSPAMTVVGDGWPPVRRTLP